MKWEKSTRIMTEMTNVHTLSTMSVALSMNTIQTIQCNYSDIVPANNPFLHIILDVNSNPDLTVE